MARLVSLFVENFKKVKTIFIVPKGWVTILSGQNEAGKTSVLGIVTCLLRDAKAIPDDPIHHGAKKAIGEMKFDDGIELSRTITPKGTTFKIMKDGVEQQKPAEFLCDLIAKDALDAMDFFKMDKKKQRKFLLDFLKIDVDKIDSDIKAAYAARTEINRKLAEKSAQYKAITIPTDAPDEEVSTSVMIAQINIARENNDRIASYKNSIAEREGLVKEKLATISRLQLEIADIEETMEEYVSMLEGMEPANLEELIKQSENLDKLNAAARLKKHAKALMAEGTALRALEQAETTLIEEKQKEKQMLIESTPVPVPGLSFDDDQILFNGMPLDNASNGKQVVIGVSMIAEMLPKDGIRILRVRNGSDLDDKNLQAVCDIAEEKQVNVIIERVAMEPSKGALKDFEFYIQDGELAA